jgi:hypothetical protein
MGMPLRLDRLAPRVRADAEAFLAELARAADGQLHSLYVVGSAAGPDWRPGRSDINTLLLLRTMDFSVLEALAPLGARFRRQLIAAPLVMDTHYVHRSLDVFPMEFLELRLLHETVAGEDLLAALPIARADLRRQCEREVKSRLVGLGQGYLGTGGDARRLGETLARAAAGYLPLARAVLFLLGQEPQRRGAEAIAALAAAAGPDAQVFAELLALRAGGPTPGADGLRSLFERCYRATERLGRLVDELPA